MKGKLIIISAPSGSGKTSIVKGLLAVNPQLEFSISATSRQPRGEEKDGKEYYFISPEEFRKKIAQNAFAEWEEVYPDTYYGTLRSEMERIWEKGQHILFDIDVMGGLNLKKQFGKKALAIFVKVPELTILEERLRKRKTESEESIKTRIQKAIEEAEFENKFDAVILNDKLEAAVKMAQAVVKSFLKN